MDSLMMLELESNVMDSLQVYLVILLWHHPEPAVECLLLLTQCLLPQFLFYQCYCCLRILHADYWFERYASQCSSLAYRRCTGAAGSLSRSQTALLALQP